MKKLLIILLWLSLTPALCQEIEINAKIAYGSFNMEDLKNYQSIYYKDLVNNLGLPAKKTDDFPGYYGAEGQLNLNFNYFQFGVYLANFTTGGRVEYSDYSGGLSLTHKAEYLNIGGVGYYNFSSLESKVQFLGGIKLGVSFVQVLSDSYYSLSDPKGSSVIEYKANNMTYCPSLKLNYYLLKNVVFSSEIGYQNDYAKPLVRKDDGAEYTYSSKKITADFSGIRVGVGMGINIDLVKTKNE